MDRGEDPMLSLKDIAMRESPDGMPAQLVELLSLGTVDLPWWCRWVPWLHDSQLGRWIRKRWGKDWLFDVKWEPADWRRDG